MRLMHINWHRIGDLSGRNLWNRTVKTRNWSENHPRFQIDRVPLNLSNIARRLLSEGLPTIDLDLPRYDVLATICDFRSDPAGIADKLLVAESNLSHAAARHGKRRHFWNAAR